MEVDGDAQFKRVVTNSRSRRKKKSQKGEKNEMDEKKIRGAVEK